MFGPKNRAVNRTSRNFAVPQEGEKAPSRAFSLLRVPSSASTANTLLLKGRLNTLNGHEKTLIQRSLKLLTVDNLNDSRIPIDCSTEEP